MNNAAKYCKCAFTEEDGTFVPGEACPIHPDVVAQREQQSTPLASNTNLAGLKVLAEAWGPTYAEGKLSAWAVAEIERLGREIAHRDELEKFAAPLSCATHGLVPNLGLFQNKCPACERDRLRTALEDVRGCRLATQCGIDPLRAAGMRDALDITREIADKALSGEPTSAHETAGEPVPTAWMRGVRSYIPGEPDEWDADFSYGDDRPDGGGWVPLYRMPVRASSEGVPSPDQTRASTDPGSQREPSPAAVNSSEKAAPKRAYYETHEPPHCPTCACHVCICTAARGIEPTCPVHSPQKASARPSEGPGSILGCACIMCEYHRSAEDIERKRRAEAGESPCGG